VLGCLAVFEEAVRILPAEPSPERARVLAEYAQFLMLAASLRDAVGRAEEALVVARTVGARAGEGHALDILGSCTIDIGQLERALRIAEEVGNAEGIVRAYLNLGATLGVEGRTRDALAVNWRGLAAARELGLEQAMGSFLTGNLADTLFDLGDWEDCDRVLTSALERESTAAFVLHRVKGQLEVGRGDFQSASHHLELARRLNPAPFEAVWPLAGLAELAIWQGRHDDASAALDEAMGVLEQLQDGDDGLDLLLKLLVLQFCVLGLRAAADRAELARAKRSAAGVDGARRRAEPLVATVTSMTGRQGTAAETEPLISCSTALAQAEWSRLEGRPDPEAWQRAAECWERLEHRYAVAYARFRQAEALLGARAPRAQIQPVLRGAHQTTVALGAGPLRREIELLANRGRLHLQEPTAPAPAASPSPAASLGLTRREAEVLALVAAGRTNRQIGGELFITEKTASIHVSRILAKLGVAGRGEAAAVAHRLGLDR
jgi:ATP/maltotriose-dependent transcriptional regulator MalT